MRRFLYFLPLPGANAIVLRAAGLIDRFAGVGDALIEHCITGIDAGPAGSGCIVAAGPHPPTYDRANQQWTEGANRKYWVGVEDFNPRPQDLEREIGIAGHEITLADGLIWRVPLIRRWDGDRLEHVSALPKTLAFTGGKATAKVQAKYRRIDELAGEIFQSFRQEKTIPLDLAYVDAVDLLAVNYRIGPEEASLLGLLDEAAIVRVMALAIDEPAIQRQAIACEMAGLRGRDPVIDEE